VLDHVICHENILQRSHLSLRFAGQLFRKWETGQSSRRRRASGVRMWRGRLMQAITQ